MRLKGFDLNQLVCLEALLSQRNVTLAAAQVHLSQSAMSSVLAQLRDHFDDALLVRSGRKLVLTPFAKTLIAPLSELMANAQSFTSLAPAQDTINVDRELKIVASDYSMNICLSRAIELAVERIPNLRFDILPLSSASAQLLGSGEIDLLIAGQALNVGSPPNECLFEDKFVCLACAHNYPDGPSITAAEYMQRRHVVVRYFEHQMAFEDEEALRRVGLQRSRQITVWSYSLVPPLLCGTTMIATVTSRIAHHIAERWPVKILPFPFKHEPVRVYAYHHPSRASDLVLNEFQDCMRNVISSSV